MTWFTLLKHFLPPSLMFFLCFIVMVLKILAEVHKTYCKINHNQLKYPWSPWNHWEKMFSFYLEGFAQIKHICDSIMQHLENPRKMKLIRCQTSYFIFSRHKKSEWRFFCYRFLKSHLTIPQSIIQFQVTAGKFHSRATSFQF